VSVYIREQKKTLWIKKIAFRKEEIAMNTNLKQNELSACGREFDEELIGVLTAISIVSKRLAQKLAALSDAQKAEENI